MSNMNNLLLFSIIFYLISASSYGQEMEFAVSTTCDTLYFGNYLGIKYSIKNAQGDFQPPLFEGFDIVGGPNVSSQFSMINGEVNQSSSYEYILRPLGIGEYFISGANLKQGNDELISPEVVIYVVENPLGIRQDYRQYGKTHKDRTELGRKPLSAQDSLRLKLRKIKTKKI